MRRITQQIATEIQATPQQVDAAIQLLDEGATVPFIARYRKEVTQGLDDTQLRSLQERLIYLRELDERRHSILNSIREQGKLTDALQQQITAADTKTELEDLYLPFKPKRQTRGQMAIAAGLEPLADLLLSQPERDPDTEAQAYLNPDHKIPDVKSALDGARFILIERLAEQAELLSGIRSRLQQQAQIQARVQPGKEQEGAKFRDYFNYQEALHKIPSHRALALLRGRNENILSLQMLAGTDDNAGQEFEQQIATFAGIRPQGRPADGFLASVAQWAWKIKILPSMETELLGRLREQSETEAIRVFARNLHALLMAAPAGARTTLGLDPGLRTGVKVTIIDPTGKLLAHSTIFPHVPQNQWDKSLRTLTQLCRQHKVELISIGNGTGSRETDKLVSELISQEPGLNLTKIIVNEAGASIYSASELAAKEFPDLDVSLRGAVSIARRLQDPLAELVKIEPKSIGVGQYQHDVNQQQLARSLDAVVEDCVNAVGVDVNTASEALLRRVSGLTPSLARNLVEFRNEQGPFTSRQALRKVPRLGDKTFEQCAGFLRITGGSNPLDASAVHPETYPVVERIARSTGRELHSLIGDSAFLASLDPKAYTSEHFGLPTVQDILRELDKPGRDPRPEFRMARLTEGVHELKHLTPGQVLEGTVTNVTNFGAFVDIGVHQDGLVHISALGNQFVKDPHQVIKTGAIVKVKVLEIDLDRKRISLTMRLDETAPVAKTAEPATSARPAPRKPDASQRRPKEQAPANSAFADALAAAFKK